MAMGRIDEVQYTTRAFSSYKGLPECRIRPPRGLFGAATCAPPLPPSHASSQLDGHGAY
ncbi:hypothetical protein BCR34DRAFT_574283 [Clohesyomyces aquaticus]|uniref:Uncharacterized protein n=1 Tax=Clohesyomyces aquaticus TaxID=1231657 RepID=A0A1Y1YX42_9PLEO|nr:hypothetical protein BCR34DRAFT_574283 [Clohesyomyces aquaticus]